MNVAKEWSQIFDLGDTALIVWVTGNEMLLKILHLTEQPVQQYFQYIQQKKIIMPQIERTTSTVSFLKTEEDERTQLRSIFEMYSAAKIIADGIIVPNLFMDQAISLFDNYKRFGKLVDDQRKVLKFMTTSNILYSVDFDRYYFKKEETVFVEAIELNQIYGYAKSFDMLYDQSLNKYIYVVGASLSADTQGGSKSLIDQTLYFISENYDGSELEYKQPALASRKFDGIIRSIKNSVSGLTTNLLSTSVIGSKRVQPDIRILGKAGFEEGVVSVKAMTNGLVAVVYTTGVMKIWSVVTNKCLVTHDLFEGIIGESIKNQRKITEAKIQTLTDPFHPQPQMKSFRLVVAYSSQDFQSYTQQWNIEHFFFSFSDLPVDVIDNSNDNLCDLSSYKHELVSIRQQQLYDEVTDLILERTTAKTHLWLTTYNKDRKESKVQDLLNANELVWDRQSQEQYEIMFDSNDLPYNLKTNPNSPFIEDLKQHFYRRLTHPGRFSFLTLKDLLLRNDIIQQEINNDNLNNLLFGLINRCDYFMLDELLNQAIMIEKQNSQIVGMSIMFQDFPFRFIIRPLGISLLKADSLYTSLIKRQNSIAKDIYHSLDLEQQAQQLFLSQEMKQSQQGIQEIISNESLSDPMRSAMALFQVMNRSIIDYLERAIKKSVHQDFEIIELITQAFRESHEHEQLYQELSTLLNIHRMDIEIALNSIIEAVTKLLLENNAASAIRIHSNFKQNEVQYSAPLIYGIQTSLSFELTSIQQLLRDLLMMKVYLQINKPQINISQLHAKEEDKYYQSLIFWYKQLLSFNHIFNKPFNFLKNKNTISIKKAAIIEKIFQQSEEKIISTFKMLLMLSIPQALYLDKFQGEVNNNFDRSIQYNLNLSQSFRRDDQQILDYAQDQNCITYDQEAMFSNMVVEVVKKYMFKESVNQELTKMPRVAKKLFSLGLYDLVEKYLQYFSGINTIAFDFLRALTAAINNKQPSQFLDSMCKCLSLYHTAMAMNERINFADLIYSKKRRTEIFNYVSSKSQNEVTQFYLVLICQLQNLDERYALFVINSALIEEKIPKHEIGLKQTVSDRDLFLELMFQTASIAISADYKYHACSQVHSQQLRQSLVAQFLEQICQPTSSAKQTLYSKYFFSQDDIDLALDSLMTKVFSILKSDTLELRNLSTTDKIKKVELLVLVINVIAQIYQRQWQISRFLWEVQKEIQEIVKDHCRSERYPDQFVDLLKLQQLTLVLLHCNAKHCGEHLFITDDTDVQEPSKKRKNLEMQVEQQIVQGLKSSEDVIREKGYSLVNEINRTNLKFNQGSMKIISINDVAKQLFLVEARIKCADFTSSEDPDMLMKILTEVHQYSLALQIAQEFKLGISYPLTYLIQSLTMKEQLKDDIFLFEEEKWIDFRGLEVKELPKYHSEQQDTFFDVTIRPLYNFQVTVRDLVNLAQGLISATVPLPIQLEQQIVKNGHIKEILEFYQSKLFMQNIDDTNANINVVEKVIQALITLQRYLPKSVTDLIQSDLILLVQFLQDIDQLIEDNRENLKVLVRQKEDMELISQQSVQAASQRLQVRDNIAQDLINLMGSELLNRVREEREQHQSQEEIIQTQASITKTEEYLDIAETALIQIKEILKEHLNK